MCPPVHPGTVSPKGTPNYQFLSQSSRDTVSTYKHLHHLNIYFYRMLLIAIYFEFFYLYLAYFFIYRFIQCISDPQDLSLKKTNEAYNLTGEVSVTNT